MESRGLQHGKTMENSSNYKIIKSTSCEVVKNKTPNTENTRQILL